MDNFTRIRKIGKGNFGDVSLVQRKTDGLVDELAYFYFFFYQFFALKRIDLRQQEGCHINPLNELYVLRTLSHPNIIQYYDAFTYNEKMCILMEYADNSDLLHKVKEMKVQNQFFDENKILDWFTQICLAVHYLHSKKILHRDIKLSNIFLSKDGMIKLGDFSISKILGTTTDLTQTGVGTPYYLSPEICSSSQYNHKSDIWMLGCALFELCSLEKPFLGDSINSIIQTILNDPPQQFPNRYSSFLKEITLKMLEKNPEKRPESFQILQIPQINQHLRQLLQLYKSQSINITLDWIKQKPSYIDCPPFLQEQQEEQVKTKNKTSHNSIHYLIEKAKEKQQSPIMTYKKLHAKTPSQNTTAKTKSIYAKQFTPSAFTITNVSQQNQQFFEFKQNNQICTQGSDSSKKIEDLDNKDVTAFKYIFNPHAPTSPNRTILFSDFLRRKLGDYRFNLMRKVGFYLKTVNRGLKLLENSPDPMKVLNQQKELVAEIIGEQNIDCIKVSDFDFLYPFRFSEYLSQVVQHLQEAILEQKVFTILICNHEKSFINIFFILINLEICKYFIA